MAYLFRWKTTLVVLVLTLVGKCLAQDPYEAYLSKSEDFRTVKQDKDWALKAFPSWTYMPWTYRWNLGYTLESGRWSVEHGYNGAFIDHGEISDGQANSGRLDWIEKHGLRFYVDHVAGKGILHLWDGDQVKGHFGELHGTGVRKSPLNAMTKAKLQALIDRNLRDVKASPQRAAYALDDEPSWGHFVHPTMWRITDDDGEYMTWLAELYGENRTPKRDRWWSYDDIRTQLATWSIADFDASPLMDQWSFNDSKWGNYIGELVEYTNAIDPATPCGIVGGQMPSPFGGYDYAKLMRKVQFIESYNIGSSQSVIRSFNPRNALPAVTTHFHKSEADTIWQTWYYLAHGNRGHIGWVDGWFNGTDPQPWHDKVLSHNVEAANKIGPLMRGAEWKHDGVAIYYNHASIQLGWILDAEAHGKTWVNRNNDERLSSAANVRLAWENMLRDSGVQYSYLSYVDAIQGGIPSEYRVLILPACLCLSEVEARVIRSFCERGGTVIADYMPGLWDQHGKGRAEGGILDGLFGIEHKSSWRASDVFGDRLWVEVNQDANYSWTSFEEFLTKENTCRKDPAGFHVAVRSLPTNRVSAFGKGKAVLMNLSPQWYNAYRTDGFEESKKRSVFMQHVLDSKVIPQVRIEEAGEREHGYTTTHWKLESGREIVFLCMNPEIRGTSLGGGNSVNLKTARFPVSLRFKSPIRNARNERTGQLLGDGSKFSLEWKQNEALVVSFDGG